MPDYQILFEQLRDAVFSAQKEIANHNYGNAERILSQALQKEASFCLTPSEEISEHSSLAYLRRHSL